MNAGLLYRESAVAGANPIRLVILLYDQAIEDLRRAIVALRQSQIEERTRQLNHALQVIGYLQATLDNERGGKVAENLKLYYEQLRKGVIEAQCQQSEAGLERQISYLMQVREAWSAVEQEMAVSPKQTETERNQSKVGEWNA